MKRIIQTIRRNKKFLISAHVNPDPDALCSELALGIYLRSLGKKVSIINHGEIPRRFHFFPGARGIKSYQEQKKINYDVAIIVDCGDLSRIGKVQNLIKDDKILINIDHHITNDFFGTLNLVQPESSSTAEILYELLSEAKCAFTQSLAMHLYAGIMTDTGSFRYANTTARTHAIAAELRKFKFSVPGLYRNLYEGISFKDLKEFTKIITNFDIFFRGKVVCIELRKTVLSKFSEEFDLRDTIFQFLRSMKNVEVFVIFTETKRNKTRVNLRSTDKFNVAKIADYYNGGGHYRASGCMVNKSIPEARKDVLAKIRKAL